MDLVGTPERIMLAFEDLECEELLSDL